MDDGARERNVERGPAVARHGDRHLAAGLAAQDLDDRHQAHAVGCLSLDADDQIARLDAGARGGRIVDRRDHLGHAVVIRELDAEPAEPPLGVAVELVEFLGVHIVGMRIEAGEHAFERVIGELFVVHRMDIARLDLLHHAVNERELASAGVGRLRG